MFSKPGAPRLENQGNPQRALLYQRGKLPYNIKAREKTMGLISQFTPSGQERDFLLRFLSTEKRSIDRILNQRTRKSKGISKWEACMQSSFEEEHLDILQNIEWSILTVYRAHPDLTDYQVDSALEALIRSYQREKTGGQSGPPALKTDLAKAVYAAAKTSCDFRMGRENAVDEENQPISIEPVSIDEIQACLKRLRKSVQTWNKRSGTRGYLDYISKFIV